MKKHLFLWGLLLLFSASANDFPNNSFEYDLQPLWNRMPDENVMRDSAPSHSYSSDCVSGKRSLHLKGKKAEIVYESDIKFKKGAGIFSLKMKSPQETLVKLQCVFYLNTNNKTVMEKSFKVTNKWKTYELSTGYPFGRFRRSGMTIGPVKLIIDPGKGEVLVDDCILTEARKTPKRVPAGPAGGVPEKEITIPAYIPLPSAADFAKGKCRASQWEFRLFPGKAGAERNASLSGVMLFPRSTVFFNSGTFSLYDGSRKLPAHFYPIAAWPQDRSLAALKVVFKADTAAVAKTLLLKFTPGEVPLKNSGAERKNFIHSGNVILKADSSNLWEKNGSLGKAVLKGFDYSGKKYTFKTLFFTQEHNSVLRRGKLISADGHSIGFADIRTSFLPDQPGVTLDISIANTSQKFIPIKELYWECSAPEVTATQKRTIWGDHQKGNFTEKRLTGNKENLIKYTGTYETLPQFNLSDPKGSFVHVFNGAQTFPNELEMKPGLIRGALWPSSAKVLSLAPGLTLRKTFLVSPAFSGKTPDHPATVMPAAKHFADSKVMISMRAADPKVFPFFESRLKAGLGKLTYPELHKRFCYGQFNYGDHPGDGGWGNLESFEDYVLYHRAVREENPLLFRLAQSASRHYADIDTDVRNALPHIHSTNHIIGGTGFGHAWIPGVMSAWLLTGDPVFYQTAKRMFNACIALPLTSGEIQQGRNFGFYLLTLAEGYAIFNDPAAVKRYMAQLNYQINRFSGPPRPEEQRLQRTSIPRQNSLFYVMSSGLVPFHCWYGLTAFLKMYELTGDPLIKQVMEKEFANIMNLDMTYRPQIETHWPGLPAEKLFPTIATDYLFGRGAFFYPVLAMYAQISGKKEFLDLAVDTAYCGLLATHTAGNIQDVFMAAPLAEMPADFDEAKQLKKIRDLLRQGAAPQLLNGDFSQSLLYSDLVIPKNGIGTPCYPEWALKKPYPRYWHFVEGKQIISSMFMTYRGHYYTLDNEEFGKSAPSLRLDMTTRRYFSGGSLTSAKFRITPGEWEYSVSIKKPENVNIPLIGMRIMAFGKYQTRLTVKLTPDNKVVKDEKSDENFELYALSYKDLEKTGWKRLTFRFRLKDEVLGVFLLRYGMTPKAEKAHCHIDDAEIKRIGN